MKNLLLLFACFICLNIQAQWTTETDVNTQVSDIVTSDIQTSGTNNGLTYVVYYDELNN